MYKELLMSNDVIQNWVRKSKQDADAPQVNSVNVIKRVGKQSRGNVILEIAERLRPWFTKMFEGIRDEHGQLVQPARIRAIALNVAQDLLNEEENKDNQTA